MSAQYLTPALSATYLYIRAFIEANGYSPLAREVAAHFSIAVGTADRRIRKLRAAGYITYKWHGIRTIEIVNRRKAA